MIVATIVPDTVAISVIFASIIDATFDTVAPTVPESYTCRMWKIHHNACLTFLRYGRYGLVLTTAGLQCTQCESGLDYQQ